MKFTEGYWRVREGFTALHPKEVYSVDTDADANAMTVFAPTNPISFRGHTLSNPTFTINLTSPAEGVIGVTVEHFTGAARNQPDFELFAADDVVVQTEVGDAEATYRSGSLEAVIDRTNAHIEFRGDGKRLTGSGFKGIGLLTGPDGDSFIHEELAIGIGESVYGLGERFGHLVKNGQVVDMWNDDSGTSSDRSYKNIPFYFTNNGYGVFVNHPEEVSFEVGSEKVGRVQFSVPGQRLQYYVIYGPSPKEILARYTRLTGRPPRVPAWSYGLWLTTSFITDYDEQTVSGFIDGMAERDIPLSVFHYDCFWMREFRWCDFEWDKRTFPDPEARLREHHDRQKIKVCVWINPYIGAQSPLFTEGKEKGYLLKLADGGVYQTDFWQSGMGLVDFTNPDARAWYRGYLKTLLDSGVDCFKTDFGESVPTNVVYHDGSDPLGMHNYYTHMYNKTVFDLLVEERGEGEAVLFARSASVGGQQFPVHWGGDCESTYEAMAETLRGGLSLGSSGFGYWAHDIGGFEGMPDPTLYKRWVAFGLLSSHSRLHGSSSVRVPWAFDEESVDVLRQFTKLKLSLLPTLAVAAEEVVTQGTPMVRPMVLDFVDDPAVAYLDRQYMLGSDLLVAPIFRGDGVVDYYAPAGRWTNILTGDTVQGPGWQHETHDVFSLPLLAREGAVIAVQDDRSDTEGDLLDGLRLRLFSPIRSTTTTHVFRRSFAAGAAEVEFVVDVSETDVTVTASDQTLVWTLDLDGTVVEATGGVARATL